MGWRRGEGERRGGGVSRRGPGQGLHRRHRTPLAIQVGLLFVNRPHLHLPGHVRRPIPDLHQIEHTVKPRFGLPLRRIMRAIANLEGAMEFSIRTGQEIPLQGAQPRTIGGQEAQAGHWFQSACWRGRRRGGCGGRRRGGIRRGEGERGREGGRRCGSGWKGRGQIGGIAPGAIVPLLTVAAERAHLHAVGRTIRHLFCRESVLGGAGIQPGCLVPVLVVPAPAQAIARGIFDGSPGDGAAVDLWRVGFRQAFLGVEGGHGQRQQQQ